MTKQNYQTILVEEMAGSQGRAVRIWLNRPELRNAFDPVTIGELTTVFQELAQHLDVQVLVLAGRGKSFCSGADLAYMRSMAKFTLEENRTDADRLFEMFWTLRSCPQLTIARLHGHVMGGALGLVAACDVAVAADQTQFCFSEVRLGLAPAVISPFVLEKMRSDFVQRYFLTGEVFGCNEATAGGLVQISGDEAAIDDSVEQLLQTALKNAPEAIRATKHLLQKLKEPQVAHSWSDRRQLTTDTIAKLRASAEGQEGLRAFLEKRPPAWRTTTAHDDRDKDSNGSSRDS